MKSDSRESRRLWLVPGAVALGVGVWSMHFVAMLAFTLPVQVQHNAVITAASVVPALIASAVVLHLLTGEMTVMTRK